MARDSNEVENFMPMWIADYLADTTHLTTLLHGAYDLLLYSYWRRGGPLPDDDAQLSAIAKMTMKDWKKVRPILANFFRVGDGVWRQKRAEEELEKARARLEAQRARTEAATNARKNVTKAVTSSPGSNVTSTTPSPTPPSSLRDDQRARLREADFDRFWDAYPRRPDSPRLRAIEAWNELGDALPDVERLISAVSAYETSVREANARRTRGSPTEFRHPHSWLSERCWEGVKLAPGMVQSPPPRGISPDWTPIAEAFAKAHGWSLWDATMPGCKLFDGPPLAIEFKSNNHRSLADDSGVLGKIETIAEALGIDLRVTTKSRVAA